MIASTSAIKVLFLATLAVASRANDENGSSTLLRGNNHKDSKAEHSQRELVVMDMSMGLDQMNCQEHVNMDGSVVCTFRTMPPADLDASVEHHDCLSSTLTNSDYCLSSKVTRIPYNEVVTPQVVTPQIVTPPLTTGGVVGKCPLTIQATGMACAQYVPSQASETTCWYTFNSKRTQCDCALQDNIAVTEGWNCRTNVYIPAPAPVMPPITIIDANVQNFNVKSPTPAPIPTNTGVIVAILNNPDHCSATPPVNGTSCGWGERCAYYQTVDGVKRRINCDCGNNGIECRVAQKDIYSF